MSQVPGYNALCHNLKHDKCFAASNKQQQWHVNQVKTNLIKPAAQEGHEEISGLTLL